MVRVKNGQQRQQLAAVHSGLMDILVAEIAQRFLAIVPEVDIQPVQRLLPLPGLVRLPVFH
ncbi:hypothetical protein D3C71_2231980 [compost metagenome]